MSAANEDGEKHEIGNKNDRAVDTIYSFFFLWCDFSPAFSSFHLFRLGMVSRPSLSFAGVSRANEE